MTTQWVSLNQNMVPSLTYKEVLRHIVFPVFSVPNEDFYIRDGLLLLDELVIDDKNQSGNTLGVRRLQTPHKLKALNKAYEEFFDLIKENPGILIDSSGTMFYYEKSKYCKIKSAKIKKKEGRETHTRIWCEKINFPFILKEPHHGKDWASILYLDGKPWLLYDLSEERQEDRRRKI